MITPPGSVTHSRAKAWAGSQHPRHLPERNLELCTETHLEGASSVSAPAHGCKHASVLLSGRRESGNLVRERALRSQGTRTEVCELRTRNNRNVSGLWRLESIQGYLQSGVRWGPLHWARITSHGVLTWPFLSAWAEDGEQSLPLSFLQGH